MVPYINWFNWIQLVKYIHSIAPSLPKINYLRRKQARISIILVSDIVKWIWSATVLHTKLSLSSYRPTSDFLLASVSYCRVLGATMLLWRRMCLVMTRAMREAIGRHLQNTLSCIWRILWDPGRRIKELTVEEEEDVNQEDEVHHVAKGPRSNIRFKNLSLSNSNSIR